MYTFGLCSLWHLATVSVVKCSVIVLPLTHFTIFTDRVLRAIICAIWTLNLVVSVIANVGVTGARFKWITSVAVMYRQNRSLVTAFAAINVVVATLIIMIAYTKVFLVVRRQVRSMPTDVLGPFGSTPVFGSSVRSAKNLFVMCAAYYVAYFPAMLKLLVNSRGLKLPEALDFAATWINISSAALNGFLYIALHSSVRRELRRYLPRCRRRSVAPALTQPVDRRGAQRYLGTANIGAGTHEAPGPPVNAMTSSCQHVTRQLQTVAL